MNHGPGEKIERNERMYARHLAGGSIREIAAAEGLKYQTTAAIIHRMHLRHREQEAELREARTRLDQALEALERAEKAPTRLEGETERRFIHDDIRTVHGRILDALCLVQACLQACEEWA